MTLKEDIENLKSTYYLKETIKKQLQKHYPNKDPEDFFNDPQNGPTFGDNQYCHITINDNHTITVTLSIETRPGENAQEIRKGITITYLSWNDYAQNADEDPVIRYTAKKTIKDPTQIVPTIETFYNKIDSLRFDL